MALRLLLRYSFWMRAASTGSYTCLLGLGGRYGCGLRLDPDGPFWGAFGAFCPWPSTAALVKASRNASRPPISSSARRSSSSRQHCCLALPLVGSGRDSSAESLGLSLFVKTFVTLVHVLLIQSVVEVGGGELCLVGGRGDVGRVESCVTG